jgi:hypothetical protein
MEHSVQPIRHVPMYNDETSEVKTVRHGTKGHCNNQAREKFSKGQLNCC